MASYNLNEILKQRAALKAKDEKKEMDLGDTARVKVLSPMRQVMKRFMRNRLAIFGTAVLAFMFLFAFIGPLFYPYAEDETMYKYDQMVSSYAFVQQRTEFTGYTLDKDVKYNRSAVAKQNIIILEGIHALNPKLTKKIPDNRKYRIFISTLTGIPLDNHNCIPTSDNRLLRRIVRDCNKGAFTARETISQWPKVRAAEDEWIYPFQEQADVMFNSAYLIEFAVLRNHAEPILRSVPKNCPEYSEAHRLLKFIHYFTPVSDSEIPLTSLLREFVGGSSFK